VSSLSGTIYLKAGTMDLRGNGFQMASQIITGNYARSKKSWSSISPWSSTDATAGAVGAVMP
jgi:hypothetical protein